MERGRGRGRGIVLGLAVAAFAGGCSVNVPMVRPAPSQFRYETGAGQAVTVVVKDSRPEGERNLAVGTKLTVNITGIGPDLSFLADSLAAELSARGIPAKAGADASAPDALVVDVDRFYFRHRRATGFSPWVTFTNVRARTSWKGTEGAVAAYFHADKVPVWSMGEIVEPTYNFPLSVAVKEIATKLNRLYFKAAVPPGLVRGAMDNVARDPRLDAILELGFFGSSAALPTLETLAKDLSKGAVSYYALDAIGIIGDPGSFGFLKGYCGANWGREVMFCWKAVGDLGTPEALAYLREQKPEDNEVLAEILRLYVR